MSDLLHPHTGDIGERSLFGSQSDGYGQCCPPVFDPSTLIALIGGIALATFFLRLVIVTTNFGRSFRSSIFDNLLPDRSSLSSLLQSILTMEEEIVDMTDPKLEVESLTTADNRTMVPPLGCRLEVWQCMSGLLERYIRYVDTPQHFATSLQPLLYKAVFHGGVKSMWSSAMEVPAMRKMTQCINEHDSCVAHDILLRDVNHHSQ